MTRVVLLRHGETPWNADKKHIGVTDMDLSQKGWDQAVALAKAVKNVEFAKVYSSGLKRAVRTAEAVCREQSMDLEALPGLNEINFGEWEGLTWQEIRNRYAADYERWLDGDPGFTLPAGDSWDSFRKRVMDTFEPLIPENDGKILGVVSHGGVIKTIICSLSGFGPSFFFRFHLSPASISILDTDGRKFVLTVLNDTCHLPERLQTEIIRFSDD